jgi:hypothetical protein
VRATIVVAHGAGASVVARHGLYGIAQLSAGRRRCPGASCCLHGCLLACALCTRAAVAADGMAARKSLGRRLLALVIEVTTGTSTAVLDSSTMCLPMVYASIRIL